MTRMAFVPRESVVVHDTWDTTGLRGTASNDFSCEDVFVPDKLAFQIFVEKPHSDWALYRAFPLAVTNHGTQSLGVAPAALEAAYDPATTKTGWGGVRIADVPRIQQM